MQCEDLLKMLNDYIDGDIDPGVCDELESHLEGCNPCQVVVDNIRQTITLYKGEEVFEMPVKFRERLHQSLREHWQTQRQDPDDEKPS